MYASKLSNASFNAATLITSASSYATIAVSRAVFVSSEISPCNSAEEAFNKALRAFSVTWSSNTKLPFSISSTMASTAAVNAFTNLILLCAITKSP